MEKIHVHGILVRTEVFSCYVIPVIYDRIHLNAEPNRNILYHFL